MNNWKRKIGSRKFWALVSGVAVAAGTLIGRPQSEIVQVTALITALGSVVVYMLSEASVDKAAAKAAAPPNQDA